MTANFHNPMWLRLTYTGIGRVHHQTLNLVNDGTPTPGSNPFILPRAGTAIQVTEAFALWLDVWRVPFSESVGFGLAEVFYSPSPTIPPLFIYAFDAEAVGGAGVEAPVKWGRASFNFKTYGNGFFRVVALESNILPNLKKVAVADLAGYEADIVNFLLSTDCPFVGEDGEYPLVWQSETTKTDDTLRKKGGGA